MIKIIRKILFFYYDGFSNLSWWGKQVWIIILVKVFIIFAILKFFFFHDFLERFESNQEKGNYVMEQLLNLPQSND